MRPRPFNVTKFRDKYIVEKSKLELQKRFQALAEIEEEITDENLDIEDEWSQFLSSVIQSAEITIGRRRGTYKERRISAGT